MDFADTYGLWADSHVFYQQPLRRPAEHNPIADQLAAWDTRIATDTPNGSLLADNQLFSMLRTDEQVSLLHVTHALREITEHGVLYPSGGCLVGSVYCTPLTKQDDGYQLHNLGEYVLAKEAPLAGQNGHTLAEPTPLIIEMELPTSAFHGLVGIDYLRLGTIHLGIYQHLEYLLARSERHQLRDTVVNRVKNTMAFLGTCVAACCDEARPAPTEFLDLFAGSVSQLPILGYLYFEVLSEYLMLHSTNPRTTELRQRGEFNNWLYKELLFGGFPAMAGKFDLARFWPSVAELAQLVPAVDDTIDLEHLLAYTAERLALLVCGRLLTPAVLGADWSRLRWEFDALIPYAGPLLGHLIHRELRAFGRYPDFYFYFDQYKALQAWNYWNHLDVVLPFNAAFPKGEIGINPAYPALEHRVYRAELAGDGRLVPVEQLQVAIAPRLVDLRYTLMRAPSAASNKILVA
jgi:hypothetical protein